MQAIAKEMNLSETVFMLEPKNPKADYRVRIFTPQSELPFAGHPTVAACHAFINRNPPGADEMPTLIWQECKLGLIPVEVTPDMGGIRLTMTQGAPSYKKVDLPMPILAQMLGCAENELAGPGPEIVSTGVEWLVAQIKDVFTMQELAPNQSLIAKKCRQLGSVGITVFCLDAQDPGCQVRLRTFAPGEGVPEDPVCGSGNGSVAAYVGKHCLLGQGEVSYQAEQGIEIKRPGRIHARFIPGEPPKVKIGGQAVKVIEGKLEL
jgi:PhzF family phenazine biosynthesis protein